MLDRDLDEQRLLLNKELSLKTEEITSLIREVEIL